MWYVSRPRNTRIVSKHCKLRRKGRSSSRALETAWPCPHLDFGLSASRAVRQWIFVVWGHPAVISGYGSQGEWGWSWSLLQVTAVTSLKPEPRATEPLHGLPLDFPPERSYQSENRVPVCKKSLQSSRNRESQFYRLENTTEGWWDLLNL